METLFQTLGNTTAAMKKLHSTASTCLSMAEKGSATRAYDSLDIIQACLAIAFVLVSILAIALVVFYYRTKHHAVRYGTTPINYYPVPTCTVVDTVPQRIESSIYPVVVSISTRNLRK